MTTVFLYVGIWAALLCVLTWIVLRRRAGALTLAYFLGVSLIHVPGILILLDPVLANQKGDYTVAGYIATLQGMAAFILGSIVAARWKIAGETGAPSSSQLKNFESVGLKTLALGAFSYFVLVPLSFDVPSLTALISPMGSLLIIGIWFRWHESRVSGKFRKSVGTILLLPLLPLSTLAAGGFIGFGIYWILTIVTYMFVSAKRRRWYILAFPLVIYFGLSLFVVYMEERGAIRELVWEKQADYSDRLERISRLVTDFEFFDLNSKSHLALIDSRLNQNYLAGAAIARVDAGDVELAYGDTVAWWSFIPRALWPDKPAVGGGGDLVSTFTGIQFAEGTSVGAGQVLEFYVNFGEAGLLLGFFGLGALFMWLDRRIVLALSNHDLNGLIKFAMPGLVLLQPGGNLREVVVAFVAATVAARVVVLLPFLRKQKAQISSPAGTSRASFASRAPVQH